VTQSEIAIEKTWRLRRRLTLLNKARIGAIDCPNGMSSLTIESIDREIPMLREELTKRNK
jgi:hypothetical protein